MNTENNRLHEDSARGSEREENSGESRHASMTDIENQRTPGGGTEAEGESPYSGEQGTSPTPGPAEEGRS